MGIYSGAISSTGARLLDRSGCDLRQQARSHGDLQRSYQQHRSPTSRSFWMRSATTSPISRRFTAELSAAQEPDFSIVLDAICDNKPDLTPLCREVRAMRESSDRLHTAAVVRDKRTEEKNVAILKAVHDSKVDLSAVLKELKALHAMDVSADLWVPVELEKAEVGRSPTSEKRQ